MRDRDGHGENRQRRGWRFNPFEIAVYGYKNSGKTTLLEGVARILSRDLRLAYLKHDAHHFDMDHPGKDTDRMRSAGVESVVIAGSSGFGHLVDHCDAEQLSPYALLAADAVLVEGFKASGLPRIMLLDEDLAIVDDAAWAESPPVAVAHPWRPGSIDELRARPTTQARFGELPWFDRSDVAAIAAFIRQFWSNLSAPPRGLLLTGGHSTRMGQDKALVDYHGCTQIEYGVRLLARFCSEVWVSCRADQGADATRNAYPVLVDRFLDMGPTGGILTALARGQYERQAWLVLACDLPRVNADVLGRLLAARNPFRFATAFRGTDGFAEPLCAIWEPKAYPRLLQFLGMGYECPRKLLINSPVSLVDAATSNALDNGNDPRDFRRIHDDLHTRS